MYPDFTAHPGTVTFVARDGSARTEPADRLPEWLKFAPTADGPRVAVVRVVHSGTGVRSYAADGRLLSVTLPVPATPVAEARVQPAGGWF